MTVKKGLVKDCWLSVGKDFKIVVKPKRYWKQYQKRYTRLTYCKVVYYNTLVALKYTGLWINGAYFK